MKEKYDHDCCPSGKGHLDYWGLDNDGREYLACKRCDRIWYKSTDVEDGKQAKQHDCLPKDRS